MSYKQRFEDQATEWVECKEIPPVEERIEQVNGLIEWYYHMTGNHYNNSYFLEMLGTYILADDLRNKSTHKVKQTEYPVLSHTQQKLRNRRERRVGDENLDFIKLKEVDQHPNAFKTKTQNKDE